MNKLEPEGGSLEDARRVKKKMLTLTLRTSGFFMYSVHGATIHPLAEPPLKITFPTSNVTTSHVTMKYGHYEPDCYLGLQIGPP